LQNIELAMVSQEVSEGWATAEGWVPHGHHSNHSHTTWPLALTEGRGPGRWDGGRDDGGPVCRADRTRPLHSAAVAEVCVFFAFPTSPSGRYRLVALTPPRDLFVDAKDLFVEANVGPLRKGPNRQPLLAPPSFLVDEQKKHSDTYNRASRIPTTNEITQCRLGLISFAAPFCAAPRPNQKRSLSIDRYRATKFSHFRAFAKPADC